MDEQKIERINDFLKKHGQTIDTISKSRLSQFEKIDDVNMECEVLYVTSDSCDLKELNIE